MKHIIHRFSNIPFAIEYYIGMNTRENIYILDLAYMHDIWFHAEEHSSCHVIARVPKSPKYMTKKQRSTIIKMGCVLCKVNTNSLRNQKNIHINYTEVKNMKISKTDGTVCTKNLRIYAV